MKFKVVKEFTFQHDDGQREKFNVGEHDRPDHIALHWYVLAHTDKAPKDALAVGTPQHAAALRALTAKRKQQLEEALEALEEAEAALSGDEGESQAKLDAMPKREDDALFEPSHATSLDRPPLTAGIAKQGDPNASPAPEPTDMAIQRGVGGDALSPTEQPGAAADGSDPSPGQATTNGRKPLPATP